MNSAKLHLDDNCIRNNIRYVQRMTRAINRHLEKESECRHLLVEVLKEADLDLDLDLDMHPDNENDEDI